MDWVGPVRFDPSMVTRAPGERESCSDAELRTDRIAGAGSAGTISGMIREARLGGVWSTVVNARYRTLLPAGLNCFATVGLMPTVTACRVMPLDGTTFYGEIPSIPGVWANAKTLEACRDELESVLEGWVLLRIADHTPTRISKVTA